MSIIDRIKKDVPLLPGCYIYFDKEQKVIYVGKAKKLKNRMLSYFNRANNTKTQHLVSKIASFDFYITKNESEALILENNLIKKYNPFYNIVLKDDKTYPYILVTGDKHPKIVKTRVRNLKGKYYGPYISSTLANLVVSFLNTNVPLRKCNKIPQEKCVYYDIKQCYGPCIQEVSKEDIKEYIKLVDSYLQNDMKKIKKQTEIKMMEYAKEQKFEQAQKSKLFLELLGETEKSQSVQLPNDIDLDYIGYYKDDNFISICILKIKAGKLINIHRSLFPYYDDEFEDISAYLYAHYENKVDFYESINETINIVMEKLLLIKHKRIENKIKSNLEEICINNAHEYYKQNIEKITKEYFTKENSGFDELKKITNDSLNYIEMIDISHIGGDAQVGAVIVYEKGKKAKKLYRKYKIKDENNLKDDYGSIREVLLRRYTKAIKGNTLPDLLIVDGGKGQVSSALEILKQLNIHTKVKLIGLSKDDKHTTKGIVNKNLEEKIIPRKSELYKFLYNMQEEVHRFAIDFHRQVKVKSLFQSELDNIQGIGPKRKKLLIEHFEYVDNIKKAKEVDFKELNLPVNLVESIMSYFQKK